MTRKYSIFRTDDGDCLSRGWWYRLGSGSGPIPEPRGPYDSEQEAREAAETHFAARVLGTLGGRAKSEAKAAASRINGRKGGRPRKQ